MATAVTGWVVVIRNLLRVGGMRWYENHNPSLGHYVLLASLVGAVFARRSPELARVEMGPCRSQLGPAVAARRTGLANTGATCEEPREPRPRVS